MAMIENNDVPIMNAARRRAQIIQQVMEDGRVSVSDLVKRYNITEASIRRDLILLEADHRLKRIHGGAVSVPGNLRTDTFVEKAKLHIRPRKVSGRLLSK